MKQPTSDSTNQPTNHQLQKDPDEWVTGDEPMTAAQASYLKTLSDEAGEDFDESLTKADASKRIDELQHVTGRGLNQQGADESASSRAKSPARKVTPDANASTSRSRN